MLTVTYSQSGTRAERGSSTENLQCHHLSFAAQALTAFQDYINANRKALIDLLPALQGLAQLGATVVASEAKAVEKSYQQDANSCFLEMGKSIASALASSVDFVGGNLSIKDLEGEIKGCTAKIKGLQETQGAPRQPSSSGDIAEAPSSEIADLTHEQRASEIKANEKSIGRLQEGIRHKLNRLQTLTQGATSFANLAFEAGKGASTLDKKNAEVDRTLLQAVAGTTLPRSRDSMEKIQEAFKQPVKEGEKEFEGVLQAMLRA